MKHLWCRIFGHRKLILTGAYRKGEGAVWRCTHCGAEGLLRELWNG